jgi:hypothetical protein
VTALAAGAAVTGHRSRSLWLEKLSELSGAVRKSETVTLGYPVEPVTDGFLD